MFFLERAKRARPMLEPGPSAARDSRASNDFQPGGQRDSKSHAGEAQRPSPIKTGPTCPPDDSEQRHHAGREFRQRAESRTTSRAMAAACGRQRELVAQREPLSATAALGRRDGGERATGRESKRTGNVRTGRQTAKSERGGEIGECGRSEARGEIGAGRLRGEGGEFSDEDPAAGRFFARSGPQGSRGGEPAKAGGCEREFSETGNIQAFELNRFSGVFSDFTGRGCRISAARDELRGRGGGPAESARNSRPSHARRRIASEIERSRRVEQHMEVRVPREARMMGDFEFPRPARHEGPCGFRIAT